MSVFAAAKEDEEGNVGQAASVADSEARLFVQTYFCLSTT